ncbi:hypothetical protein PMI17_02680 [Pantoea sp. GM01]|nr:hypothetical protein PMI17_02680 [Pantoea sp. GM01]
MPKMTTLKIVAAGSLRAVWPDLVAAISCQFALTVNTEFGPAGMLRHASVTLCRVFDLRKSADDFAAAWFYAPHLNRNGEQHQA